MKNHWVMNVIIILVFTAIFASPLGSYYSQSVLPGGDWINVDPNNLFSGALVSLSFIVGFLSILEKRYWLLIINLLIILLFLWLQAFIDIRFNLAATALGLVLGFLGRWIYGSLKKT